MCHYVDEAERACTSAEGEVETVLLRSEAFTHWAFNLVFSSLVILKWSERETSLFLIVLDSKHHSITISTIQKLFLKSTHLLRRSQHPHQLIIEISCHRITSRVVSDNVGSLERANPKVSCQVFNAGIVLLVVVARLSIIRFEEETTS